jgi:hypothetical protein
MAETITIDGRIYSADELAAIAGVPVDPPLSPADIATIEQALEEAISERTSVSSLLGATTVATLALLLSRRSRPGIYYVEELGAYYNGRTPIPQARIDAMVSRERQRLARESRRLAQRLVSGRITLEEYQEQISVLLSHGYLRLMAAGNGGKFTGQDYEAIQRLLWGDAPGNGVLNRVIATATALTIGTITAALLLDRSRRYGSNIGPAFNIGQAQAKSGQQWQARRFLGGNSNHCPSCPALQVTEWRPASEVTAIGDACECQGNCLCTREVRLINLSTGLPV